MMISIGVFTIYKNISRCYSKTNTTLRLSDNEPGKQNYRIFQVKVKSSSNNFRDKDVAKKSKKGKEDKDEKTKRIDIFLKQLKSKSQSCSKTSISDCK